MAKLLLIGKKVQAPYITFAYGSWPGPGKCSQVYTRYCYANVVLKTNI